MKEIKKIALLIFVTTMIVCSCVSITSARVLNQGTDDYSSQEFLLEDDEKQKEAIEEEQEETEDTPWDETRIYFDENGVKITEIYEYGRLVRKEKEFPDGHTEVSIYKYEMGKLNEIVTTYFNKYGYPYREETTTFTYDNGRLVYEKTFVCEPLRHPISKSETSYTYDEGGDLIEITTINWKKLYSAGIEEMIDSTVYTNIYQDENGVWHATQILYDAEGKEIGRSDVIIYLDDSGRLISEQRIIDYAHIAEMRKL